MTLHSDPLAFANHTGLGLHSICLGMPTYGGEVINVIRSWLHVLITSLVAESPNSSLLICLPARQVGT